MIRMFVDVALSFLPPRLASSLSLPAAQLIRLREQGDVICTQVDLENAISIFVSISMKIDGKRRTGKRGRAGTFYFRLPGLRM